jgi:DNA-binding NarL/FixJ family response regulator
LVSSGRQTAEIAKALELGEKTVRSHLKKAQGKLGARKPQPSRGRGDPAAADPLNARPTLTGAAR